MDLNLTAEESTFRDELRAWLAANVPKDWDEWREKPIEESFPYLRAWQRKLHEGRWAAVSWPKEYGGRSATPDAASHILGRDGARRSAAHGQLARSRADRPHDHCLWNGSAKEAVHSENSERGRNLVPRFLRAERRLRSRRIANGSASSTATTTSSTARKSGPATAGLAIGANSSCAPIANVPKHKGLTVLLVDMKSPGVEVRPLRQMTGESEFNELFFRDVRVPVANVLGKVNDGWNVAMSTLMYERGSYGARLHLIFKRYITRLIELSRSIQRNGKPAAEDPIIRQKFAQCNAEIEIMRFNQMRAFSRITATGVPGPGRLDPENFLERTQSAPAANRARDARALRAIAGRRSARDRQRSVVLRLSAHPREYHRSRHIRSATQHHRPFRSRTCPEATKGTRHAIRLE